MWANLTAAQKKLAGGIAQATHLAGDMLADIKAEYADREDIASEEDEGDEGAAQPVRMHTQDTQNPRLLSDSPVELEELRQQVAVLCKEAQEFQRLMQAKDAEQARVLQALNHDHEAANEKLVAELEQTSAQLKGLQQEREEEALQRQEQQQSDVDRKRLRENMLEQEQKQEQQAQELATLTAELTQLKQELQKERQNARDEDMRQTQPEDASALKAQLEHLQSALQQAQAELQLNSQHSLAKTEEATLADIRSENEGLRTLNAQLMAQNTGLLEQQGQLEEKLATFAPLIPDSPGCCTPVQQLAIMKAEIERLQGEARQRSTEQALQSEQMAQLSQLQERCARDAESLNSVTQQLFAANQTEQALRTDSQALTSRTVELETQVQNLQRELAEKMAHIVTLGKGKEDVVVELTSELEKAQNERAQVETLLVTCQKQYEGAVNQIKKLQQECQDACHNEDAARQKASQTEALVTKYKGEVSALESRLERVLQNQADTQEGAQEEQTQLREQIASLNGALSGHQAMVDRLNKDIQVRAIRETEIREAADRELAAKELEIKLANAEAERLRTHLRETAQGTNEENEEVYQINQQLRAQIRQLQLDAAAASSLTSDMATLRRDFDLKSRECESNAVALVNLETVISSFQRESGFREQKLSTELGEKKAELQAAREELGKLQDLETRLGIAEKVALDSKNELLAAQRHAMLLTGENSALRGRLAKFQQYPTDQNLVDRRIVVKMLMAYFERADKEDVIQVMYRMFQFSPEERNAVDRSRRNSGIKSGIAKVASMLSPFDEPPPPMKEGEGNLADLWVDFLLKESSKQEAPGRGVPSTYPSSSFSSQETSSSPAPSLPPPVDLPPLVSGHFPSIRPKVITSALSSAELLARHGPRRATGDSPALNSEATGSSPAETLVVSDAPTPPTTQ